MVDDSCPFFIKLDPTLTAQLSQRVTWKTERILGYTVHSGHNASLSTQNKK